MQCEVCDATGRYPIFDRHGRELYMILCPECFGTGLGDDPPEEDDPDLPPPSTAAQIKSDAYLRAWMQREWPSPSHPKD